MPRYSAYLIQAMSQVVEFEAPEGTPVDELEELAWGESDLEPNVSNKFDKDGDGEVYRIKNLDTGEVVQGESDVLA